MPMVDKGVCGTRVVTAKIKRLLICDIDGVVADLGHRLKYIGGDEKDWDKFYGAEMAEDGYFSGLGELICQLADREYAQLVFMTGRPERTHELTRLWLNDKLDIGTDWWICCRHDGDHRKSPVVKREMVEQFMEQYETLFDENMGVFIFDDDPGNLKEMDDAVMAFGYNCTALCVGTDRY